MLTVSSIESVRPRSNARRILFVEMSDYETLPQQVVRAMNLKIADTFSSIEEFKAKAEKHLYECAKERSLRIVSRKDCTLGEVGKKLSEDCYDRATITAIRQFLIEYQLCDDAEYLRRFVSSKLQQGIPERKIRQDLIKKHLEKDAIEEELEKQMNQDTLDNQLNKAIKLIENISLEDKKSQDKAFRKLVSRGYTFDQAKKAIKYLQDSATC